MIDLGHERYYTGCSETVQAQSCYWRPMSTRFAMPEPEIDQHSRIPEHQDAEGSSETQISHAMNLSRLSNDRRVPGWFDNKASLCFFLVLGTQIWELFEDYLIFLVHEPLLIFLSCLHSLFEVKRSHRFEIGSEHAIEKLTVTMVSIYWLPNSVRDLECA